MTDSLGPGTKLRNLVTALDEERPTEEEAREVVAALGVDIPALAARLRARATAASEDPARRRLAELRERHEAEARRRRAVEPSRPRGEQVAEMKALLARAAGLGRGAAVSAHFRKFEEAGDEELRLLVETLRELLDEGEPPK